LHVKIQNVLGNDSPLSNLRQENLKMHLPGAFSFYGQRTSSD